MTATQVICTFAQLQTNIHFMNSNLAVDNFSEIGKLKTVILHTPGQEVANMTPENTEKALYSDILNLSIAKREHGHFENVLAKVSETVQLKTLLTEILKIKEVKSDLIYDIYNLPELEPLCEELENMEAEILSSKIIEGLEIERNNLTNYLNTKRFIIQPLHNLFFMRDASVSIGNDVLISRMAGSVRKPETLILDAIFKHHPRFGVKTINIPEFHFKKRALIEGGDVMVVRDDLLVIGMGARTNSLGIDLLIEYYKSTGVNKHIIVQELPLTPESFIHLDMVFTILDREFCMVYEPVILSATDLKTVHIHINEGSIQKINDEKNLLDALKKRGLPLQPIICGGYDTWTQKREQWHSGTNFFSFAPGKIIGYARNLFTLEQLSDNGFEVIKSIDVIENKVHPDQYQRCVITFEGAELARGGGGARCMTMPVAREKVSW